MKENGHIRVDRLSLNVQANKRIEQDLANPTATMLRAPLNARFCRETPAERIARIRCLEKLDKHVRLSYFQAYFDSANEYRNSHERTMMV